MERKLKSLEEALQSGLQTKQLAPIAGFTDWPHAWRNLEALALRLDIPPERNLVLARICYEALQGPDPNAVLNNFERLAAAVENPEQLHTQLLRSSQAIPVLAAVFGFSQFLADVIVSHPDLVEWLLREGTLKQPRSLVHYRSYAQEVLKRSPDRASRKNALCRLRRREMLRIGARDILGMASVEDVTREISELAQAIVAAAVEIAREETVARFGEPMYEDPDDESTHPCSMCVIAMGKLGGRELNFSSDIDLVFLYEEEGTTTGVLPGGKTVAAQSNHVFFTRMSETLIKFLAEYEAEGMLFRVDMRLRPEGKFGPLARSLESFANYLDEQARDWERLAYLKARVLAGPSHLAERIYRIVQRFVFFDVTPARIVAEIEKLKLMIDREVIQSDSYQREVKRGHGGIREIEFVVSAMQIIYGKAHRALRARNIFVALERLREVNLFQAEETRFYLQAYEFLRLIEHRLQMAEERQTHLIPESPLELEKLAKKCHFPDSDSFLEKYRQVTAQVHRRFVQFFEQDTEAADRETHDMLLLLDPNASPQQARQVLERRGFSQSNALYLLHGLAHGTREVFISPEGRRSFEQMLPALLRLAAAAPLPDQVLPHLHSFVLAVKGITYYYELIAHHPDILRLLVLLFGTSGYFSDILIAHPEFFDALISSRVLYEQNDSAQQRARLETSAYAVRNPERRLVLARRGVKFEMLLEALRTVLNLRPLRQTLGSLSELGDNCIRLASRLAAERLAERFKAASPASQPAQLAASLYRRAQECFAVIALGKYGGRELNFFSDLDLVFVYDDQPCHEPGLPEPPGGLSDTEFFTLFSDTLRFVISENLEEGRMFALDARLRPHGRNAPIATSLPHYLAYLEKEARIWELQTLLRARHVFGNPRITHALGDALRQRARSLPPDTVRQEMLEMRRRLEASVPADARAHHDFKRSPGGLVDIEFLLQYQQLVGQVSIEESSTNYFELLDTLEKKQALSTEQCEVLRCGYDFLRSVETSVRLISGSSSTCLPDDPIARHGVERLLGFGEDQLEEQVGRTTRRVREVFLEVLG